MADRRIVCTNQDPTYRPPHEAHIVAVGIGEDANRASEKLTVNEVYVAMDRGDRFHTRGNQSGKVAQVRKWNCRQCTSPTLRSDADAIADNNLDNLRTCSWG